MEAPRFDDLVKKFLSSATGLSSGNYKKVSKLLEEVTKQYAKDNPSMALDVSAVEQAFKAVVKEKTRSKGWHIKWLKAFTRFMEKETRRPLLDAIAFPECDIDNRVSRILYITNLGFTDPEKVFQSRDDLANMLWCSTRTIDEDYSYMAGDSTIPLGDRKFRLPEGSAPGRGRHPDTSFHPLTLICNVIQTATLFLGLHRLFGDPVLGESAKEMTKLLWGQLSDYARGRVVRFTKGTGLPELADYLQNIRGSDDSRGKDIQLYRERGYLSGNHHLEFVKAWKDTGKVEVGYEEGGELRTVRGMAEEPVFNSPVYRVKIDGADVLSIPKKSVRNVRHIQ